MSTHEHEPGHTSGTADRAPRDLGPPVGIIHLAEMAAQLAAERERHNRDHSAYTLRNAAGLRQVLLSFRPGGRMPDHHADGAVAIHVLAGEVAVEVAGTGHVLAPGDILDLAPGLHHSLEARAESSVLLTIAPAGAVPHASPAGP